MSEFVYKPDEFERALEKSLLWTVQFLQAQIIDITPRDLERLPQNINRKDGKAPMRSTHFKPVSVGGNWYPGITGKLKQSIAHQMQDSLEFKIGISAGPTLEYAKYLEFGTRRMRPRSFLRKGIIDNKDKAKEVFEKLLKSITW